MKTRTTLILLAWITFAVVARLAPHPANLSPLTAMAVLSGAIATPLLGRKAWLGWAALLVAMVISDCFLGFYASAPFVYVGFIAAIACGHMFNREVASTSIRKMSASALTATVAGSVAFFAISNLGVWFEGVLYPLTVAGFAACYFAALPFLMKSLSADLVFAFILFGAWAAVRSSVLAPVSNSVSSDATGGTTHG